jgi:hypothetical protein
MANGNTNRAKTGADADFSAEDTQLMINIIKSLPAKPAVSTRHFLSLSDII